MARSAAVGADRLNRATLARQLLLARARVPVRRAAGRLAGLNAQDPDLPYLSLHARTDAFQPGSLTRLLLRRDLVKATFFRGTIHIVTADDYVLWREAITPVLIRTTRGQLGHQLEHLDVDAVLAAARAALEEAPRMRADLTRILAPFAADAGMAREDRVSFAARMLLPLVQIPPSGEWGWRGKPAYRLAETWLGRSLGPADVGRESMVLRYLAAFGPATVKDAQYWSGLSGLREVFATLRPRLRVLHDDTGRELFDMPRAPLPDASVPAPPRLVPSFDNVLYAHDDRRRLLSAGLDLASTGWTHKFLVRGRVAGNWVVERAGDQVRLDLTSFDGVPRAERSALREEAARTAAFLAPDAARRTVDLR